MNPFIFFPDQKSLVLFGHTYFVEYDPLRRNGAWICNNHIAYNGENSHKHIKQCIKQYAQAFFTATSKEFAQRLNLSVKRITIKDTRSRWGSCSSKGNLNFSWRLALAPRAIAMYVAAHEVCHLQHMSHCKKFWALVHSIFPSYKEASGWLKNHGSSLFIYP